MAEQKKDQVASAENVDWMNDLPAWPEGVATKEDLLRWLKEQGMTVEEFKETDLYHHYLHHRILTDPFTAGPLLYPWLREL